VEKMRKFIFSFLWLHENARFCHMIIPNWNQFTNRIQHYTIIQNQYCWIRIENNNKTTVKALFYSYPLITLKPIHIKRFDQFEPKKCPLSLIKEKMLFNINLLLFN